MGKEFAIAAKRIGQTVIAVDSYENAPAAQLADFSEVINMLDGKALDGLVEKYKPDYIVPEIEAIRTERLYEYEKQGYNVIPSAKAANYTMNRKAIRDLAAKELGLKTPDYRFATSAESLRKAVSEIGMPCVVKLLMSSSGKGQSTIKEESDIEKAWQYKIWNINYLFLQKKGVKRISTVNNSSLPISIKKLAHHLAASGSQP